LGLVVALAASVLVGVAAPSGVSAAGASVGAGLLAVAPPERVSLLGGGVGSGVSEPERSAGLFETAGSVPVREDRSLRTAGSETWVTADGSRLTKLFGEDRYFFSPVEKGFVGIDNRVGADEGRPGWLRNAANAWTVRFGPLSDPAGGVVFEVAGRVVRVAPAVKSEAGPEAVKVAQRSSSAGNQVVYRGVWPGVDVVYTVTAAGVREELVVNTVAALKVSRYDFVVDGATLAEAESSGGSRRLLWPDAHEGDPVVEFPAPVVTDVDGALVDQVKARPQLSVSRAEGQVVSVSVDSDWLAGQGGALPVVIDPSAVIQMPANSWTNYASDGSVMAGGLGIWPWVGLWDGAVRSGAPTREWRSLLEYNTSAIPSGGRVVAAELRMSAVTNQWWEGASTEVLATMPDAFQFGQTRQSTGVYPGWSWGFAGGPLWGPSSGKYLSGVFVAGSTPSAPSTIDVTELVDYQVGCSI
jgi:hypothetical protein